MLNNDEQLRNKINGFLRRKEVQYPELLASVQSETISNNFPHRHYHHTGVAGQ